jgi:hypothetical protein
MSRKLLIAIAIFFSLGAAMPKYKGTIFIIKEDLANCTGIIEQKCMQVKSENSKNWEFFYDNIEGFNYKQGYRYKLLVEVLNNPHPLQDSSNKKYRLIKILSKQKYIKD